MSRQLWFVVFAAWTLTVTLLGCKGGNTPSMEKVSGLATLHNKPLTKGSIQFMPDNSKGTHGRMALGEIGPDGKFILTTFKPGDGVQVGFYRVVVNCQDVVPFDPQNPKQPPRPKSLIPERYADENTSGLTAEVKQGTQNKFTFELTN
ncbi:MAG: hypothetical protein NTY19_18930 [Planctomycetota bacterium]|nr:hypothetical protein [Planctomycetota bacterium]